MLYIFHVNAGNTITFDIKLALQTVAQLKESIQRECGVNASLQVLLMSGGVVLDPNQRVCSYSAGTDTSPIFLFDHAAIGNDIPPIPTVEYGSDVDLQTQFDLSLGMPVSYNTVVARAQLAQHCCQLDREMIRICEKLVHDQHLQQQGWAAVVANLEDTTYSFQIKCEMVQQNFNAYLAQRAEYKDLIANAPADMAVLSKIPILPPLRASAEGLPSSPDDDPSQFDKDCSEGGKGNLSLLQWIATQDNRQTLEEALAECGRDLEQFNENGMSALKGEMEVTLHNASIHEMREIKGLGERLFSLEQLMQQARKFGHAQGELALGFHQNQTRASNLGDTSVLPDLCSSHKRQLVVMLQNHNQLRDIKRRCAKAKEELTINIHHRLKWIIYVENKINELNDKIMMYNDKVKRLRTSLCVFQQIHVAPQMYMDAVTEVVRRRTFSQAFSVWASNLACQLLTIHSEELACRREFQNKFGGHFLNSLFPGLHDTPPSFATQAPPVFDNWLPKLTADHVESLKSQVPDLALTISSPDLNSITQFFSKSLTDETKEKDSSSMRVDEQTNTEQEQTRAPMLFDRGGFESETDTEEFEKIGQGATDSKPESYDGAKQMRQKQMEENLGNTREEVERLRSILKTMKAVMCEVFTSVRQDLAFLRDRTDKEKTTFFVMTERIRQALSLYSRECDRRLQEREQELTVDHELEMGDVKKLIKDRNDEICALKRSILMKQTEFEEHERLICTMRHKMVSEKSEAKELQSRLQRQLEENLEKAQADKDAAVAKARNDRIVEVAILMNTVSQCQTKIQELKQSLSSTLDDQQRMVQEATDKLQLEHNTELESIRSRFKLMPVSTMDRSPSESSLEKIDYSAIPLMNERLKASIRLLSMPFFSLQEESSDEPLEMSQSSLEEVAKSLEPEKDEVQVSESKKVRLEAMIEDERNLSKTIYEVLANENKMLKSELQSLREGKELAEAKIESLETDKVRLEIELVKERSRSYAAPDSSSSSEKDMTASVAVVSDSDVRRDAATSPKPQRRCGCTTCLTHVQKKMKKTAEKLVELGHITVTRCDPGDRVFVFWDPTHGTYTLYQESPTLHFLNCDSTGGVYRGLNAENISRNVETIVEIVEKQYCHARKSENRYRVPRGTKFYRVTVKPVENSAAMLASAHEE